MAARKSAQQIDVSRVSAPVVKVIMALGSLVFGVVSLTLAYNSIINRMDRMDQRQEQAAIDVKRYQESTTKVLDQIGAALTKIADNAVTPEGLKTFCIQSALANVKSKWTCYLTGPAQIEDKPTRQAQKPKADTGLFGILGGN